MPRCENGKPEKKGFHLKAVRVIPPSSSKVQRAQVVRVADPERHPAGYPSRLQHAGSYVRERALSGRVPAHDRSAYPTHDRRDGEDVYNTTSLAFR
jgi:hypothetical protein